MVCLGTQRIAFYDSSGGGTIRCEECHIILPPSESRNRCGVCEEYRQVLNRMVYRMNNENKSRDKRVDCQSHTNYRFLIPPEKDERMKNLHQQLRLTKQQLSRLHEKLNALVEDRNSVEVDDDLNQHLSETVKDSTDLIAKSYPEGSFAMLFWKAQCRALSLQKNDFNEVGSCNYQMVHLLAAFVWRKRI